MMNERPPAKPGTIARSSRRLPGKEEIKLLEPFVGLSLDCILVPDSEVQFAAAAREIRAAGAVGFDTESKPVFIRGAANAGPDIAQFATDDRAFVIQFRKPGCRAFLEEILQSGEILKIGFDLQSDRALLQRNHGIVMKGVLDLCTVFRKRGYRNTMGAKSAVGLVLHRQLQKSKHVTTSNWALPQLTPRQLEYAANDAYAALMVWRALEKK